MMLFSGRKRLIGLSLVLVNGATFILTFGEGTVLLSIGRFIYGTCLGISWAAVPLYIGEISEVSITHVVSIFLQLIN